MDIKQQLSDIKKRRQETKNTFDTLKLAKEAREKAAQNKKELLKLKTVNEQINKFFEV